MQSTEDIHVHSSRVYSADVNVHPRFLTFHVFKTALKNLIYSIYIFLIYFLNYLSVNYFFNFKIF